jgi:hypothetical protein
VLSLAFGSPPWPGSASATLFTANKVDKLFVFNYNQFCDKDAQIPVIGSGLQVIGKPSFLNNPLQTASVLGETWLLALSFWLFGRTLQTPSFFDCTSKCNTVTTRVNIDRNPLLVLSP